MIDRVGKGSEEPEDINALFSDIIEGDTELSILARPTPPWKFARGDADGFLSPEQQREFERDSKVYATFNPEEMEQVAYEYCVDRISDAHQKSRLFLGMLNDLFTIMAKQYPDTYGPNAGLNKDITSGLHAATELISIFPNPQDMVRILDAQEITKDDEWHQRKQHYLGWLQDNANSQFLDPQDAQETILETKDLLDPQKRQEASELILKVVYGERYEAYKLLQNEE